MLVTAGLNQIDCHIYGDVAWRILFDDDDVVVAPHSIPFHFTPTPTPTLTTSSSSSSILPMPSISSPASSSSSSYSSLS